MMVTTTNNTKNMSKNMIQNKLYPRITSTDKNNFYSFTTMTK